MMRNFDLADIAAALVNRAEDLAAELLPGGHRDGQCWRAGSVAGEAGASLAVVLGGARRGRWRDFSTDEGGDLLDLIAACRDLSLAEVLEWAGDWLGQGVMPARQPVAVRRAPAPASPSKADRIARLLVRAVPIAGTPAEIYLKGRGLAPAGLGPLFDPAALRFAPDVWHWPSQTRLPAMIAPVVGIAGTRVQALHLTFLRPDGSGKAKVNPARLYLGPKAGGCVKLTPNAEVTVGLAIGEGIETALAALCTGYPAWALLDAGNLAAFPVLPGIEALTLLADHDPAGFRAVETVAERWAAAGRDVRVWQPPADSPKGYDLNDRLREDRHHG